MTVPFGRLAAFGLTLGCVLSLGLARADDEDKVALDKLPAAVTKAVKAKFPKATMKEASKEVEKGETTFEIAITDGGQKIGLAVKPDGTIMEVEKEIKVADLPAAVAKTLAAGFAKMTVTKAEEVMKGKTMLYEVMVTKPGGKKMEIALDPDGTVLSMEAAEDEDDDDDKKEKGKD